MSSKGAIKWLCRLEQPRTIESLITEVYGEATWYGCLFEREMADLLNFFEFDRDPLEALTHDLFNTEDWTLNQLLKEISKRQFFPEDQLAVLRDGKDARNELVHRLIATRLVISQTDKELFLAEIDRLYFRVWKAHRLALDIKKQLAAKVGVTDERIQSIVRRKEEEARIEDENLRQLLDSDSDNRSA